VIWRADLPGLVFFVVLRVALWEKHFLAIDILISIFAHRAHSFRHQRRESHFCLRQFSSN